MSKSKKKRERRKRKAKEIARSDDENVDESDDPVQVVVPPAPSQNYLQVPTVPTKSGGTRPVSAPRNVPCYSCVQALGQVSFKEFPFRCHDVSHETRPGVINNQCSECARKHQAFCNPVRILSVSYDSLLTSSRFLLNSRSKRSVCSTNVTEAVGRRGLLRGLGFCTTSCRNLPSRRRIVLRLIANRTSRLSRLVKSTLPNRHSPLQPSSPFRCRRTSSPPSYVTSFDPLFRSGWRTYRPRFGHGFTNVSQDSCCCFGFGGYRRRLVLAGFVTISLLSPDRFLRDS